MSFQQKLEGAEQKAMEFGRFKNFTRTQFRAVYAHLKSLEGVKEEERLQVETKLFLARLFYKTRRGQSPLDEGVYKFFKEELKTVSVKSYCSEFIKYLEAVLAYSYGTINR